MPRTNLLRSRRFAASTIAAILAFQALFAWKVITSLFYRTGAYFLDAGFYVYAIASERAPSNPAIVAPAWGESVFMTHTTFSPMGIMRVIRLFVGIPTNFMLYLTLQHVLTSVFGGLLLWVAARILGSERQSSWLAAALGAFFLPFSNIAMGSLGYPHVELLGASCIAIGLLLLAMRWTWLDGRWPVPVACLLFAVGVLAREDLGGHLALAVFAAAICSRGDSGARRTAWRRALVIGGAGGATTLFFLVLQRVALGSDGAFEISYSGNPPYSHITSVWYILDTVLTLLSRRIDVAVAALAFIGTAIVHRRREFLAFPLALLPWLLINVTAVDPSKRILGIYLLFPLVIYLAAPVLALAIGHSRLEERPVQDTGGHSGARPFHTTYLVSVVVFFLAGISAPPTGGSYIYTSLLRQPLVGPGEMSLTNRIVREFPGTTARPAVDDAVLSINPVALENVPLLSAVTDTSTIDSILFFPSFLLGEQNVRRILEGWITNERKITVSCLPGGMARADASESPPENDQTVDGQFNRAVRCHPRPKG